MKKALVSLLLLFSIWSFSQNTKETIVSVNPDTIEVSDFSLLVDSVLCDGMVEDVSMYKDYSVAVLRVQDTNSQKPLTIVGNLSLFGAIDVAKMIGHVYKMHLNRIHPFKGEMNPCDVTYVAVASNENGPLFLNTNEQPGCEIYSLEQIDIVETEQKEIPDGLSSQELVQPTSNCVKLDRIRGTYYLGDDPLTRKEYRDFLRVNAPDLYNRYRTGNALWATGWTLLGVSTAAFFFSGVCLVAGLFETVVAAMFGASSHVLLSTGLIIMGSSVALNVGSIPCLIYGGIYKFSTNRLYNERCERQQTTIELSLQTSQNGIGFALKF